MYILSPSLLASVDLPANYKHRRKKTWPLFFIFSKNTSWAYPTCCSKTMAERSEALSLTAGNSQARHYAKVELWYVSWGHSRTNFLWHTRRQLKTFDFCFGRNYAQKWALIKKKVSIDCLKWYEAGARGSPGKGHAGGLTERGRTPKRKHWS